MQQDTGRAKTGITTMTACNFGGESERLKALHRYEILDTAPEEAFDRITRVVKSVLAMPMVAVSLVDRDRQWFKSRQGFDATETRRDISFCTHTIQDTQPLIVRDALEDPRFANSPLVQGKPNIRFYAGVPLRTKDGHNIGALCSMDTKARDLSAEQITLLQDLARLVVDELELRLLAGTDSLTGLMSRRQFLSVAQGDVERAKRYNKPLSCLVIDIDHFKAINDNYGHAVGDIVLQRVAAVCKSELRGGDYVGRIGGEEFAIILPETAMLDAFIVAERFLATLAATDIKVAGHEIRVTASVGIADYAAVEGTLDQLLQAADIAMYDAKNSGRNRVVWYLPGDLQVTAPQGMPRQAMAS
jgi:diguanylate cyclase (GGDEF)-like protein